MGRAGEGPGPMGAWAGPGPGCSPGLPIPGSTKEEVSRAREGGPSEQGACPCRQPRDSEENQE